MEKEECEAIAMWVSESVEGCSGCDVDRDLFLEHPVKTPDNAVW